MILLAVTLGAAFGCRGGGQASDAAASPSPSPSPPPGPPTAASATAAIAFCAYGGLGPVGLDTPPERLNRVILVVDVTLDDPPGATRLALTSLELAGDDGETIPMAELISAVVVDPIPAETTWATALDRHGTAFGGQIGSGRTRLRIEAWLARPPTGFASRVRATFDVGGREVTAAARVAGVWPTG